MRITGYAPHTNRQSPAVDRARLLLRDYPRGNVMRECNILNWVPQLLHCPQEPELSQHEKTKPDVFCGLYENGRPTDG